MEKEKMKFDIWNIQVTEHLNKLLEKAIKMNAHVSKSEFVRDAVREKLKNMKLLKG